MPFGNQVLTLKYRQEALTLDDLQKLVAEIADLQGCPNCGFNGIDIQFLGDPAERFVKLADRFEGITDVTVGPLDVGSIGIAGR